MRTRALGRSWCTSPALSALALPLLAAEPAWHDSTRDVYVDGRLDRNVEIFSADAGKRLAVLLPGSSRALVLDREGGTGAARTSTRPEKTRR